MKNETELPSFARSAVNLASARLGAKAIDVSDDFFAPMERMLHDTDPVFIADKYDDHGKWMDGWESRRKRTPGHDWCVISLAARGEIWGVDIDTGHFTGNYPPQASIEACDEPDGPDEATVWREIVGRTDLVGNSHHYHIIQDKTPATHLRLNIYPDGGVARLRVYGRAVPPNPDGEIDLAAALNGGRCLAWNDAHFGDPQRIIFPGRGENMGDGWETRRRREPGNDWIITELGMPGIINRIIVDTAHFKGNYPDRCSIEGAFYDGNEVAPGTMPALDWQLLLPEQKLEMDRAHTFGSDMLAELGPVTHLRLNIFPDGGVSRLRVFGTPQKVKE